MKKGTMATCIVLIIISIYLFLQTFSFPEFPGGIGPAVIPQILLTLLIILCLINIFTILNEKDKAIEIKNRQRVFAAVLLLLLYILLMKFIGYYVATFLFIAINTRLLGVEKWQHILLPATVFLLVVYLGFVKVLLLRLPQGIF